MIKKIRKNTQLSLINSKGAGRRAVHDPGIRHTARALIKKKSALHITIKVKKIKADNNLILGKGMKALGVTLAKGINRLKKGKGDVYKHRYHFRKIENLIPYKRVLNYIFTNGINHKTAMSILSGYNSFRAETKFYLFTKIKIKSDEFLKQILDPPKIFHDRLEFLPD